MRSVPVRSVPSAIAAAASIAALLIGIVRGTYAAGGSDSSCYLNTARMFAGGAVRLDEPLARAAPWPNAETAFTPAGFTASKIAPGRYVPICPPGLPVLMAAFHAVPRGEFLVVPLLGALGVWLTYVAVRRVESPILGAIVALLVASSPTFLYQIVQPMSDVPAMTAWFMAIMLTLEAPEGRARPLLVGVAVSMALWIRLNLLPLAFLLGAYVVVMSPAGRRTSAAVRFAAGMLPGLVALALLQQSMYGSPFSTGYGSGGDLLSATNVVPNLLRYPLWLAETHPWVVPALAGPAFANSYGRRPVSLLLAFAVVTLLCYLPLVVFDAWWYTRYLLPAIPCVAINAVAALGFVVQHIHGRYRLLVPAVFTIAAVTFGILMARQRHAFEMADLEQHYRRAGTTVAERLPDRAAVITVKNSGSVRYHAGRPTILWDVLPPGSLDAAVQFLRDRGYTPYLLLELDEETPFRQRFRGASLLGELDWPPMLQVGRTIRIYDPADRARFMADGKTRTEFIR